MNAKRDAFRVVLRGAGGKEYPSDQLVKIIWSDNKRLNREVSIGEFD